MQIPISLTPSQLMIFLLHVAPVRPVFIWRAPGIGKSSLVGQFAADVGLPCVALLGSQLAPKDLIGVPQIIDGVSRFCPPAMIARKEPYCLFLDELNACTHEVQKTFYSLIHARRVGEYALPDGSVGCSKSCPRTTGASPRISATWPIGPKGCSKTWRRSVWRLRRWW